MLILIAKILSVCSAFGKEVREVPAFSTGPALLTQFVWFEEPGSGGGQGWVHNSVSRLAL